MVRVRLDTDDFQLVRPVAGSPRALHFGPEFPGDAIALYPRFRGLGEDAVVAGSFVIVDRETDEVVGQLGTMGPPSGERVEIGYGINVSACGRGIATKAVRDLLVVLDARSDVGQVVARTAEANPASGRVLEKNGFVATGREDSTEGELLIWERRG